MNKEPDIRETVAVQGSGDVNRGSERFPVRRQKMSGSFLSSYFNGIY